MPKAPMPWPQTKRETEICSKASELAGFCYKEGYHRGLLIGLLLGLLISTITAILFRCNF